MVWKVSLIKDGQNREGRTFVLQSSDKYFCRITLLSCFHHLIAHVRAQTRQHSTRKRNVETAYIKLTIRLKFVFLMTAINVLGKPFIVEMYSTMC